MTEPRTITVKLLEGERKGRLDTSKCIIWEISNPKDRCVEYLYHTNLGYWVWEQYRPDNPALSSAQQIEPGSAVWWLAKHNQRIPPELEAQDDRIDLTPDSPADHVRGVRNSCLNCMRRKLERGWRPDSRYELAILAVVDDIPRVGRVIAELASLPFNSHFRATLAKLREFGLIVNVGRHRGYRRSPDLS